MSVYLPRLVLTPSTSLLSEHCTHHNNISQSNSTWLSQQAFSLSTAYITTTYLNQTQLVTNNRADQLASWHKTHDTNHINTHKHKQLKPQPPATDHSHNPAAVVHPATVKRSLKHAELNRCTTHSKCLSTIFSVKNYVICALCGALNWIVQSPPAQYRLYGRRFLQVKKHNQQYQSTERGATKDKANNENN